MKWSVGLEAEADRVMSREEIVELADAVAPHSGVATGIGRTTFGATLLVDAADRDSAVTRATEQFELAVARAGLPASPIVRVEATEETEPDDRHGYIL